MANNKPADVKQNVKPENKSAPVEKNILADFINSSDDKLNTVHENASAASDNDGEASASLDLKKNEAEINDKIDDDLNWEDDADKAHAKPVESVKKEKLEDIPKKYWKHQTV